MDPARAEASYREVGTRLRRRVWDPLAAAIGHARRVLVVPDGALNLLSLAALPAKRGGYLVEHGPLVHYLSAERDVIAAQDGRAPGEGALVVGGADFDATTMFAALATRDTLVAAAERDPVAEPPPASASSYRGPRSACGELAALHFTALPGTAAEAAEVARQWQERGDGHAPRPRALGLIGAAATETAFKRRAAGRRVLHLATHGFFLRGDCAGRAEERENPLLSSGLALAGANRRASAGGDEEDGILTAEEIASLDLSGVEWAVLSACETGVGDVTAGEGVFGLRRAFQVAGARTMIMSLWSVDDEATRAWMTALYQGRLQRHLDTAQAVREASVSVLRARRAAGLSTQPFYWGAFVAAGDWK